MNKVFMFSSLLLPWFTLFFATSDSRKKYMPVTIFTSLLMTIIFQIAYTYKWWVIHEQIVPWGYMIDVGFAYGVFAVGTFWIFKLTSHKFILFVIVNLIMDALMAYLVLPLLGKLEIAEYKNISPTHYLVVIFTLSFIIYGYHKWQEKIFK